MNRTRARRALLALGASAIAMTSVTAAWAEAAATTEADSAVEAIAVTAQRREQALNNVGMSIQAFGVEQLQALRVTNIQDLSAAVPSFTVSRSYQGVPTYTLRGIGFNTINMSATSTVGTHVDEVAPERGAVASFLRQAATERRGVSSAA